MGKQNVFEQCPAYQSEHFLMRKMQADDAKGLFQCYSNPKSARYFNGDCCNDDFYYTDFQKFTGCMKFWESRYLVKDFVRFTIIDIEKNRITGMSEICPSNKYAADGFCMGILRLDLLPEYETAAAIHEILSMMLDHVYEDFEVKSVLMKAQEYAGIRRTVLKKLHFVSAQEECNISFNDYFVRY